MRKFLLATSAAALVLSLSGPARAETDNTTTGTIAQPANTDTDSLVFSKDADHAQTIEPAAPKATDAPAAATAVPQLSAADAAVAAQIKELAEGKLSQYVSRESDRTSVLAFYRDRGFAPLWTAEGKIAPRTGQASAFLKGVATDGLDPADYMVPAFDNPDKLAADELAFTNAVITFARHASIGRLAFSRVSGAVWYDQKAPAPADVLGKLAAATDMRGALDSYNPQSKQYKALKAELAAIRSGKNSAEPKPATADLKLVAKDGKPAKPHQQAKAPEQDSKQASVDTVLANMERWRWMPHQLASTYVMVNIPDYTLKVVQDGKTIWTTRIVVGKPGEHATPLLTETMKYITVNPTWNVPPSIIKNEYMPALARDPNALARIGLQISHNKDGSIRIFQPPGERNALGRIRFNFPNRFLVYQHDTPDKKLFALSARAYSHGCMRVQNPDEYAQVLLGVTQPEDHYTVERIRSMYGETERNIVLRHPIPVYITYQTAFTDDAGKVQSRADIYGLDKAIVAELHRDGRNADTPVARNYNNGGKPVAASAAPARHALSAAAAASNARAPYPSYPGYTSWNAGNNELGLRSAYQTPERSKIW